MIVTERLLLRSWKTNDAEFITKEFGNLNVRKLMANVPQEYNIKDAQFFLENIAHKENTLQLIILNKKTEEPIGGCGFNKIDLINKNGEIGYWVAEKYWGNGYATEATLALLKYGFENIDLHRIQITAEAENIASLKVIKKCKFIQEGILREDFYVNNKWMDTYIFSMLKSEWIEKFKK